MSIRYGNKVGPLVSRKTSFFKKNRFDNKSIKSPKENYSSEPTTWTRPSEWPTMPTITSSEEKIALLMPVYPQGSNFLAFTISGAYTVDWGDGSAAENVAAGVKAQHEYSFDDVDINPTIGINGNKYAIVVITPQAGQNLTNVNFNQKYALPGSTFPDSSPILEIVLSCPNLVDGGLPLGNLSTSLIYCKSLINFVGVNLGNLIDGSYLFSNILSLKNCDIQNHIITNMDSMFYYCYSLESVPLFNTASVTNMDSMFYYCASLASVPLFNTASVTNMDSMFYYCFSLTSVPLFNTASVTNMNNMFNACFSLESVPLFNTAIVTSMNGMFNACHSLESVPLFNTVSVTSMSSMFQNCYSLTSVPLFNTVSVTSMSAMFTGCSSLTSVPLFNTASVTNMNNMFQNCYSLTSVPLFNTAIVTSMNTMFQNCFSLASVPLFNTASVTSMSSMFSGCFSLTSVPLFNTAIVASINNMFNGCSSLTSVPLFNTASVTNMSAMFQNCYSLTSVPLFNTAIVANMSAMFNGCSSLTSVPLFNTVSVTSMNNMFNGCYSLTSVPLFNTVSVTNMGNMFQNCYSLTSVPLFNTAIVTSMSSMFSGCYSLISVPLFNTASVTSMSSMFSGCSSLTSVPLSGTWYVGAGTTATKFTNTFAGCVSLMRAALSGVEYTLSLAGAKISKDELETFFVNMDTIGAVSQTLNITGNWGAPTPVALAATTVANSLTATMANTAGIEVGMQVTGTGTPLTTARSVTFTDVGDLVNLTNHGLSNGDEVSFATIVTTTGIVINKIYYVVGATVGTFQIADTPGGAALPLTNNGSGTIRHRTEVVNIVPNTRIEVSRPMSASATNTLSFRHLKTGTALLKGWAVTG